MVPLYSSSLGLVLAHDRQQVAEYARSPSPCVPAPRPTTVISPARSVISCTMFRVPPMASGWPAGTIRGDTSSLLLLISPMSRMTFFCSAARVMASSVMLRMPVLRTSLVGDVHLEDGVGQDGQLARRIDPVDIVGRVPLGDAHLLRLPQGLVERQTPRPSCG